MDKKSHPIPEAKAEKALVVVVAPFFTNFAGHAGEWRLHANDSIVAANKMGSYSFAYLEPGEYVLAEEARMKNAVSVRIQLEAGKEYYFFLYWSYNVDTLSRNSKEVALHMIDGVDLCQWKRKE